MRDLWSRNLLTDDNKTSPLVTIKGIREGLLITLTEGEWPVLEEALLQRIDQQANFLKGAQLTLDVGNQILKAADIGHLRDVLSERSINLRALLSHSPTTELSAQNLGLATRLSKPTPDRLMRTFDTELSGDEAILIQRTLRSGHSLKYEGHVIVIGDVNPGAEIVAGGNVIVWGRLRGTVHAGADGNQDAIICALDLSPTQLRIAEQISVAPPQRKKSRPELARLQNNQVIAEPWDNK
ncbi:MAG TPA: septum site-determining protein MinC [Chloroflexi bacterium]|nr:septum site-determining protein MinC [Chloroflexota bacterium]